MINNFGEQETENMRPSCKAKYLIFDICSTVSPKGRILLAFGILAVFGVSVSVVIIAIGAGFYAPLSSPSPSNSSRLVDCW
ncbi:MAG: hypothetical protein WCF23_22245 [Candidatus Nitrosopolaris sp.]